MWMLQLLSNLLFHHHRHPHVIVALRLQNFQSLSGEDCAVAVSSALTQVAVLMDILKLPTLINLVFVSGSIMTYGGCCLLDCSLLFGYHFSTLEKICRAVSTLSVG